MAPVIKSEDPTLGRFDNSHQKRRSDPGTIRQQASKAKIRPWDDSTTGFKSEDPTLGRFDNRQQKRRSDPGTFRQQGPFDKRQCVLFRDII